MIFLGQLVKMNHQDLLLKLKRLKVRNQRLSPKESIPGDLADVGLREVGAETQGSQKKKMM
jgi:hypothetical protein